MTTKKVAFYDMDPNNAGSGVFYDDQNPLVGCKIISNSVSPELFFSGICIEGSPDAVVVDLPGDSFKKFGLNYSEGHLAQIINDLRDYNYEPVMVYPMTNEDAASKSLSSALCLFKSNMFGVFLNENGLSLDSLNDGTAFKYFKTGEYSLQHEVETMNGIIFQLSSLSGETSTEAVYQLRMPFETAWLYDDSGNLFKAIEIVDSIHQFISAKQSVELGSCRAAYSSFKRFFNNSLPEISMFIDTIEERLQQSNFKPVFILYSTKGGQGKSFMARLLTAYLRKFWANDIKLPKS